MRTSDFRFWLNGKEDLIQRRRSSTSAGASCARCKKKTPLSPTPDRATETKYGAEVQGRIK